MTISKFWTRIGALLIDFLILGLFGLILGFSFESFFIGMGQYGKFVGLIIAVLYFSILNSTINNGQTLGKKAVNIAVVSSVGEFLDFKKSLLRSIVLCSGYFLINFKPTYFINHPTFGQIFSIVFLILLISVIFFYIFNKITRQSIHDLIVQSLVIDFKSKELEPTTLKPNKSSYYLTTGLAIVMSCIYIYSFSFSGDLSNLNQTNDKLIQIDGVINAGLSSNTSTFYGSETTTTNSYNITLWVKELPDNIEDVKNQKNTHEALKIVFENEDESNKCDLINVVLARGFNIGIAKGNRTMSESMSPKEWKAKLK